MKIIISKNSNIEDEIIHGVRAKINNFNERRATIRAYGHGFVSTASLIALIPSIKILIANLQSSGFFSYISVIFSDSRSTIEVFGDFALATLASIPTATMILVVLFFLIFTNSFRRLQNIRLNLKTANI